MATVYYRWYINYNRKRDCVYACACAWERVYNEHVWIVRTNSIPIVFSIAFAHSFVRLCMKWLEWKYIGKHAVFPQWLAFLSFYAINMHVAHLSMHSGMVAFVMMDTRHRQQYTIYNMHSYKLTHKVLLLGQPKTVTIAFILFKSLPNILFIMLHRKKRLLTDVFSWWYSVTIFTEMPYNLPYSNATAVRRFYISAMREIPNFPSWLRSWININTKNGKE